jgi:hypothetical protein
MDNLLFAREWWKAIPPEQVVPALAMWRCGTQACFGGWVAQCPYFQAQGVHADSNGMPEIDHDTNWGAWKIGVDVARVLFGDPTLFCAVAVGEATGDGEETSAAAHAVVTTRIQHAIDNSAVCDVPPL